MTGMQQVPAHPLEKMNNMAERVTLPGSGIEVVVRRGDIEALTADSMRFALNTGALQEVAQKWAGESAEQTKDPAAPPRHQPQLGAAETLELSRQMEVALVRAVVAAPPLDELIAAYGGSDKLPDLGMGGDYRFLLEVVNRLNPPADKEQAKS